MADRPPGVRGRLYDADRIRNENPGQPLSIDQQSRLMDVWATHPGNLTKHAKGGLVPGVKHHQNKSCYAQGGFVSGFAEGFSNSADAMNRRKDRKAETDKENLFPAAPKIDEGDDNA